MCITLCKFRKQFYGIKKKKILMMLDVVAIAAAFANRFSEWLRESKDQTTTESCSMK